MRQRVKSYVHLKRFWKIKSAKRGEKINFGNAVKLIPVSHYAYKVWKRVDVSKSLNNMIDYFSSRGVHG